MSSGDLGAVKVGWRHARSSWGAQGDKGPVLDFAHDSPWHSQVSKTNYFDALRL